MNGTLENYGTVVNLNTTKSCRKYYYKNAIVYYSYQTPICIKFDNKDKAQATKKKYSVTTSKQQSTYINRDLNYNVEYVDHEAFLELLKEVE